MQDTIEIARRAFKEGMNGRDRAVFDEPWPPTTSTTPASTCR